MTEQFYITGRGTSSSFGGTINNYDFDGYLTMSDMAARIVADWNFDRSCKLQAENRNRRYKEKLRAEQNFGVHND